MTTFLSIQEDFQNYLLKGDPSIFPHISDPIMGTKETRISIYYTAYRLRLQEALATHYPILHRYMGDEDFYRVCAYYIQAHPSSFRSIRWFGAQMPHLLRTHELTREKPYLAELADFEWTSTLVFDGADSPVLAVEDLLNVPPEAWELLRFDAHPSLYRLHLTWNVIPLWEHVSNQSTLPTLERSPTPITWVLWRKNLTNHYMSLSAIEASALNVLLTHNTFSILCQELCHWLPEDDVGLQAASFLKGWILRGFFSSCSLDKTEGA